MKNLTSAFLGLFFIFGSLITMSCSEHELWPHVSHDDVGVAAAPVSIAGNGTGRAGPTVPVSGGANPTGVAVPTGEAVISRLQNGLESNAMRTQGNFATSISQLGSNLPRVTNVNSAAGYDQLQLLVYAACADLTQNGKMQSSYNIVPGNTIAQNQAALIATGLRMLDQHTGGIASQGPAGDVTNVTTILTTLITAQANAGSTSTMAFMTVCIAANTAGITLLGM
jgi:hypothetical protein